MFRCTIYGVRALNRNDLEEESLRKVYVWISLSILFKIKTYCSDERKMEPCIHFRRQWQRVSKTQRAGKDHNLKRVCPIPLCRKFCHHSFGFFIFLGHPEQSVSSLGGGPAWLVLHASGSTWHRVWCWMLLSKWLLVEVSLWWPCSACRRCCDQNSLFPMYCAQDQMLLRPLNLTQFPQL